MCDRCDLCCMTFCQDQLKTAAPVTQGIGKLLLERMGWKSGEGLGKNKEGNTVPLMLDIKNDRKGRFTFY